MSTINLNALPHEALSAIFFADMQLVGTKGYIGVGFYWSMEYKHTLRDASVAQRRKVHQAFLKAGLAVDGASPAHAAIVARFAR
jgi:hypothetical protein